MKCPHDQSALELRESDGAVSFQCLKCKGRWLTLRGIEALNPFPAEDFMRRVASGSLAETALPCPKGCGCLTSSKITPVHLDWCRRCKGVWFEGDELKKVMSHRTKKDKSGGWDAAGFMVSLVDAIDWWV